MGSTNNHQPMTASVTLSFALCQDVAAVGINVLGKPPSVHTLPLVIATDSIVVAQRCRPSVFNVGLPIVRAPCGARPHKLVAAILVALPQQVHKPVHVIFCQ